MLCSNAIVPATSKSNLISAWLRPSVASARLLKLMSGEIGLFFAANPRSLMRSFLLGYGMFMIKSNRPGRLSARSILLAKLVAPITMTGIWSFSKPLISVKKVLITLVFIVATLPSPEPRLPIVSNSSINIIAIFFPSFFAASLAF